jgi:hypothetical protein
MHELAKAKLQRYKKAKAYRENWVPLFEECYEYTLPMRESFYYEEAGQRRDEKIFDSTAVSGIQEFASRLQSAMVPNFTRWADFIAGSEIPPAERDAINNQLDEVTDYVFEVLQNSNFAQEVHESFMDLAVGTGVLCVEEGDSVNPVIFTSVPLPRVILDAGPNNNIDHVFRERKKIRFDDLSILYPDSTFDPKVMAQMGKDRETTVLEIVCRDYSKRNEEAFYHYAICMTTETLLYEKQLKGLGSNPFICFRWSPAPSEVYGRGPIVTALSAIKTTNLTTELILENAQMAISGIYQAEDDGVMNLDTINLVPGTVIPKAMGSAGLQPIQSAGRFDVGQLQLNEMRMEIRKHLYMDMLGDPDKTPASATEIAERMADLNRRMSATFGRLQTELVQPVLQRVIYILKKQGRIEIPTVNGREIKIRSVSPLAQGQANEDIARIARFLELVGGTFGPQMLPILINPEQTSVELAKKFGVPDSLIRDEEERKQITAMMQQMAQQQGADVGSQG